MKKLQFSAFLRDINISQHGLSISAAESMFVKKLVVNFRGGSTGGAGGVGVAAPQL